MLTKVSLNPLNHSSIFNFYTTFYNISKCGYVVLQLSVSFVCQVVDEVGEDDDDEGQLVLDLEVEGGSPRKRKFIDPSDESGSPPHTKHPFKYVCPFCGKRYTSRSGLLSHKNTVHYQRKPYRCQGIDLQSHLVSHSAF